MFIQLDCFHCNLNCLCKQSTIVHLKMLFNCSWSILSTLRKWNKGFNASHSSISEPYCNKWKIHPNRCFSWACFPWLIQCLLQCYVWASRHKFVLFISKVLIIRCEIPMTLLNPPYHVSFSLMLPPMLFPRIPFWGQNFINPHNITTNRHHSLVFTINTYNHFHPWGFNGPTILKFPWCLIRLFGLLSTPKVFFFKQLDNDTSNLIIYKLDLILDIGFGIVNT